LIAWLCSRIAESLTCTIVEAHTLRVSGLATRHANTAVVTFAEIDVDFTVIEPLQGGRLVNVKAEAYSSESFLLPEHCRPSPDLIPAPSHSPH
jgi:hypothetical protein